MAERRNDRRGAARHDQHDHCGNCLSSKFFLVHAAIGPAADPLPAVRPPRQQVMGYASRARGSTQQMASAISSGFARATGMEIRST